MTRTACFIPTTTTFRRPRSAAEASTSHGARSGISRQDRRCSTAVGRHFARSNASIWSAASVNPLASPNRQRRILLTRLHTIGAVNAERGRLHVGGAGGRPDRRRPSRSSPGIVRTTTKRFAGGQCDRRNRGRTPVAAGLPAAWPRRCGAAVERHDGLRLTARDEIAAIAFSADIVYKWRPRICRGSAARAGPRSGQRASPVLEHRGWEPARRPRPIPADRSRSRVRDRRAAGGVAPSRRHDRPLSARRRRRANAVVVFSCSEIAARLSRNGRHRGRSLHIVAASDSNGRPGR